MRPNETRLISYLQQHGASPAAELQAALRVSQPTVSRLLAGLSRQVLTLGKGRACRYALAQTIGPLAAQQTIWRVDVRGQRETLGLMSFLARSQVHITADGLNLLFEPTPQAELPWFLAPLRAQGFLGRLNARRLAAMGLPGELERWDTQSILLAALHTPDAPGSLVLGDVSLDTTPATLPVLPDANCGDALDALSQDIARSLPAGSSAGGEQPKLLAQTTAGQSLLVKFSPPLGTPFGERWSDLLHAEALASQVLQRHGLAAAPSVALSTRERTYLLSTRFDRIGPAGRTHVVALGAVHSAFVPGNYVNWAGSCEALARQGRLAAQDAQHAAFLLQFGRLIGNTDMHSGNLSVKVQGHTLAEIARGQFELAPCYDMLPMRFKPDPQIGLNDYAPFTPDAALASDAVRRAAADYWYGLAQLPAVSTALRALAGVMAATVSA